MGICISVLKSKSKSKSAAGSEILSDQVQYSTADPFAYDGSGSYSDFNSDFDSDFDFENPMYGLDQDQEWADEVSLP
jgi:hypothetical protein